jgi:hypothetical protein
MSEDTKLPDARYQRLPLLRGIQAVVMREVHRLERILPDDEG